MRRVQCEASGLLTSGDAASVRCPSCGVEVQVDGEYRPSRIVRHLRVWFGEAVETFVNDVLPTMGG